MEERSADGRFAGAARERFEQRRSAQVFGGFAGAYLTRRLPSQLLRSVILSTAVLMTFRYRLRG
ncbi:hypothetical protein ACOT81_35215 [Streptomyces sp. WI04-05B]|uniref:hypothetical protein n=1 Tax=Streptomyces TaxID=1883 RepID=UPI0029C0880E|nr:MULTISPECIES: hypothetical protein [unclassified Streptomyces]